MALQDARQDEAADRHGRFERVADDIDEVVAGQASAVRKAIRMEDDQNPQVLDARPEGLVDRVVVVDAFRTRVDRNAPESVLRGHPFQLGDGLGRCLHREGPESDEPIRVQVDKLGDGIVLDQGDPGSQLGPGPVVVLRRCYRHRLTQDSLAVHPLEASGWVCEHRRELACEALVVRRASAPVAEERIARGVEFVLDQVDHLGDDDMRMDVDGELPIGAHLGMTGTSKRAGWSGPVHRVTRPPKTSRGRSTGSSCRKGPEPVSAFLNVPRRASRVSFG